MRRYLVEAELLVIVGTDPFRRVDGALLQRRINVAAGKLLRNRAELLHHAAGKAADAEFQSLEIVDGIDFLAEPATHLAAGVASEQRRDVIFFVEFVEHFLAAAQRIPRLVEPHIRAERYRGSKSKGRVLAEIIVRRGVANFAGTVLNGIENLQSRYDLASREWLNLKFVVG